VSPSPTWAASKLRERAGASLYTTSRSRLRPLFIHEFSA
jgi:hypothetical protein